ncbi:hypothetical protein Tco_0785713 [Tanacetum coccineum]
MKTRGRKKVVGELAPPARDPRDVETIERLQQRIQELELQQLLPDSPAKEAKTKPNVWDDESVDINPFGGENLVEEEEQVVARLGVIKPEIVILSVFNLNGDLIRMFVV